MNPEEQLIQQLNQCRALVHQKRYAEALAVALRLLQLDAENMAIHRLLALLYGLNNNHLEAHKHYMLLAQFDVSYTVEHCLQVAQGYADKGQLKAAGLICMAAANRLPREKLQGFALQCFEQAGDVEWINKIRNKN